MPYGGNFFVVFGKEPRGIVKRSVVGLGNVSHRKGIQTTTTITFFCVFVFMFRVCESASGKRVRGEVENASAHAVKVLIRDKHTVFLHINACSQPVVFGNQQLHML